MSLLFKVLHTNTKELFKYLDYEDHKNLSIAFVDKYINVLLDRVNYRQNMGIQDRYLEYDHDSNSMVTKTTDYDYTIKMALENINIHSLKSVTLNRLHKGFWNHISLNCRLKEKFIYKWSHKINMVKFLLNKNCRNLKDGYGDFLPRNFSETFKTRFPGIENYKPCCICFDDTDYHYKNYFMENDWFCEECMNEYDDHSSLFDCWSGGGDDYDEYRRKHWSDDDTDYDDNEDD